MATRNSKRVSTCATSTDGERDDAQYSDLLLECAPISIVKAMNIATDTGWDTLYFGTAYGDFESRSWRPIARKTGCRRAITAAGAPARSPTCLRADYSMPLMLEDGTLYGVLGDGDAGRLSVQPSALTANSALTRTAAAWWRSLIRRWGAPR
ncbi:MAG: hypothetical protein ACLUI3_04425 [Christensenellales bacterium]